MLLWLALATLVAAPLAHAAEPLLISEAYWVDEGGKATLDDAERATFTPFEGSIAKGYRPFALWVKLRISGRDSTDQLAIIVQPAFLRRIELYDPDLPGNDAPGTPIMSGRDAEITPVNHIGLDNGFVIPSSKTPRTLFLRITTTTTLMADIKVSPVADAEFDSQVSAGTLSIYFAFLCAFLLWAIVSWAVRRDLLYGLFALRLVFSILHLSVMAGVLRYFLAGTLSAPVRDLIYSLILVTVVAVTGSFDFKLISEFGVPRWLQRLAWCLLVLPATCVVMVLLGHTQAALHLSALVVTLFVITNVVLAFSARNEERAPYGQMAINTIRVGYILMALVIIAPALIATNILHTGVPVMKVVFLHALITTVILFAILSIRARQKDLLMQEALIQYEVTERELRQESERRAEKEKFLAMLVHELRNPLTVIRLRTSESSASGKAVHQAAREMAEIIERVELSEALEHANGQNQTATMDLGDVLREIVAEHPAASRISVDAPMRLIVATDESLLRSIVRNLLDNAAKYSPEASQIRLAVAEQIQNGVGGTRLSVANEIGEAGVPDGERLFTKYYRSQGAHRWPGSGLGLFLVANWAQSLGGTIGYEGPTAGSDTPLVRFSLWLPQ
ncbi:ATP-binding protein [Aestuariivirga litoralis]|uniref:sensor histidine kinase n=1 Tax=Aestuariivirga litoralis TaxID=2650924 RepID=UPI00137A14AB|nr:ATP-binding protein [Aestuariivirga litoralis]